MTLLEDYERMLGCPSNRAEAVLMGMPESAIIDTRDHLPLFRMLSHGNVLEIGCDVGNSTTAFLLGAQEKGGHVTSVDINPKCSENFPGNTNWTFIQGNSRNLSVQRVIASMGTQFEALYVDGDHSYNGARGDIEVYAGWVKRGGVVLVHDVLHPEFPGVRKAFDEFPSQDKIIRKGSWGLGVIQL